MLREIFTGLRLFIIMLIITGVIYTVSVHYIAQSLFPKEANGSLIIRENKIIGSELIAQKFTSDKYFWARPSAVSYSPLASGGSNLGGTNKNLKDAIKEREVIFSDKGDLNISDLVSSSASGLDPHISPDSASYQLKRVMAARKLNSSDRTEALKLIELYTEDKDLGILGEKRVNVLLLNLAFDEAFYEQL